MVTINLTVNGKAIRAEVEPRTLLVQFLREQLRLTGTHVGCDTSQCGACTVHIDGLTMRSCTTLAALTDGRSVTTIEGLAPDAEHLHPMQAAFHRNHGLQCGFCTPGMIMTAVYLAREYGPEIDERTVRDGLEGNLCRCTGYQNIVKAIIDGAKSMAEGSQHMRAQENS
jgi:aerobic carbon-monoxide dehydrogenase small subunit